MGDLLEIATPSHRDQLFEGIWRLLDSEVGSDFEISCSNSPPIKAHFLVVQIFCQVLRNSSCRRIRFESSEIRREDLRCLIEFIYRGKTQVEVGRLDVVRKVALKLGLKSFIELVEVLKIENVHEDNVETEKNKSVGIAIEKERNELFEESSESLAESDVEYEDSEGDLDLSENSKSKEKKQKLQFAKILLNASANVGTQNEICDQAVSLMCSICDMEFRDQKNFRKHLERHLAPEKCAHCPYNGRNLVAHLATKHQMDVNGKVLEKSVKCDECEYVCVADFILKIHKRNVHRSAEYRCDECAYVCHNNCKLNRHKQLVHSNERAHMCETCGKCFKASDSLRNHKIMHSAKVECEVCGKRFSLLSIRRHRKLHEDGENITKYKCTICSFRSRYRFNLKVHFKKIHDMSEEEILPIINSEAVQASAEDSQLTDTVGTRKRSFKSRKKRVSKPKAKVPPKKRVCEICGVVLSCASVLFRHRRLHREGDSLRSRYRCPVCEFKTRERYNLKTHCTKKHEMTDEQFNSLFCNVPNELAENVTVETETEENKSETYVTVDAEIVNSILFV